jgi:hypothetical protein
MQGEATETMHTELDLRLRFETHLAEILARSRLITLYWTKVQ